MALTSKSFADYSPFARQLSVTPDPGIMVSPRLIFLGRDEVETVAVADRNSEGREKAAARCKAKRQCADYREMLVKAQPQLVSIAPRWTDSIVSLRQACVRRERNAARLES
jgi:hypothetical protein